MAQHSALRWQSQRAAMAKHARCDGKVSAQALFGQYAAKRKGTRWFVGRKKPPIGNEHTASRKEVKINGSKKSLKDYPKILDNARATLYESEKKMPYVQDSFCLLDGCTAYIHRPTQGWTVREYILLCKVSLLHSPSSLGLDGHEQLLSRLEDAQEVPKEPSSPCWLSGFPCTAS